LSEPFDGVPPPPGFDLFNPAYQSVWLIFAGLALLVGSLALLDYLIAVDREDEGSVTSWDERAIQEERER
jgi:hypothetical protein